MKTQTQKEISQEVRERLTALCNQRQHAYEAIIKAGCNVPNYSYKLSCIQKIRTHLEYFEHASEKANINLVHALEKEIVAILPAESSNQKLTSYRKRILKMVAWCCDQFNTDQLKMFPNTNTNPI